MFLFDDFCGFYTKKDSALSWKISHEETLRRQAAQNSSKQGGGIRRILGGLLTYNECVIEHLYRW